MFMHVVRNCAHQLLRLRYDIQIKGYDRMAAKGKKGILFLPNHPAMIDPVILSTILFRDFQPHALVDENQLKGKLIQLFQRRLRLHPMTDLNQVGACGIERVKHQLLVCAETLRQGENLLFYPSGRLYHSQYEDLRSNRGVKELLTMVPDVRVVLVRTTGLWGSSFSLAHGVQRSFDSVVCENLRRLVCNAFFFMPKRKVTVTFCELPEDFPRTGERLTINRKLEQFYNFQAYPNTFVPYYWWHGSQPKHLREPERLIQQEDLSGMPEDIKQKVLEKLALLSGRHDIQTTETLHCDLGLDSLNVAELASWIQQEFACAVDTPDSLQTVSSVMLAAIGQSSVIRTFKPVEDSWFAPVPATALDFPDHGRVTDCFLEHARRGPGEALFADQAQGVFTYKRIIRDIMQLLPAFRKFKGRYLGILLPASADANIAFLTALFAGKTPVMINWTVGMRSMRHVIASMSLETIITSQATLDTLSGQGIDLSPFRKACFLIEKLRTSASHLHVLSHSFSFLLACQQLRRAPVPETAVILFTSGSESYPKAVPLTHDNLISDLKASLKALDFHAEDRVLAIAPPFHTLGVWLDFLVPDVAGIKVVYHGNPMEGNTLARMVELYRTHVLVGTPTFISGIYRQGTARQLATVRLVAVGAEACPSSLLEQIRQTTPQAMLLEGYGITECAAVVTANSPEAHKFGTLGKPIDCVEWTIRDEALHHVPQGDIGMLYVRGPNVFAGYLDHEGSSPFVELDGKSWYRTGDLVSLDHEGFLCYQGRLTRFVKIGGEMISLPAIENALSEHLDCDSNDGRTYAIACGQNAGHAAITLFTTVPREREEINRILGESGLSPIHFVKHVVEIPDIPLLGTGKTDYRQLVALLEPQEECAA